MKKSELRNLILESIKEETQQGPSYDEVWLKDKLGNPTTDKYDFDDNRGHIDVYPDLGDMRAERSSQFIRFKLEKGAIHFVHAFGYERGYDMLKKVVPELGPMGDSSYAGFMNVNTDYGTIPMDADTANKMIDALRSGLDAEARAQTDFYSSRGPTSGTIDEQKLRKFIRKLIKENLEQGYTLDELTIDIVRQFFPKGEVSFPYPNDSSRLVRNERDLEDWKSETKNRFGNIRVFFDPNAVWYDQVQIKDKTFNKDKEDSIQAKASWIDRERKAGRTTGLDEIAKISSDIAKEFQFTKDNFEPPKEFINLVEKKLLKYLKSKPNFSDFSKLEVEDIIEGNIRRVKNRFRLRARYENNRGRELPPITTDEFYTKAIEIIEKGEENQDIIKKIFNKRTKNKNKMASTDPSKEKEKYFTIRKPD